MKKKTCNVCGETVYLAERGEQIEGYETAMAHFEKKGHAWNEPEVRKCNDCGHLWGYGGNSDRPTCPMCKGKATEIIDDDEVLE